MPPSRLLAESLALAPGEREELAAELLRSLEEPPWLSLDDVDEIERRAADVIEGREPGIPWEAVRRRIGL